ncbi:MAG: cation transporting ATPase C-terminal domain-containing protein [Terrimicrobiaceae bacterium]
MTCLLWADDAIEDRAEDSVNEFHRDFNVADARASATKGASVIRTLPSLPVDRGSEIALQKRGHVVGYMGDGINDAPSMRASDVGISVDTAVDVAKESADIILLEKSLLVFLPFLPMVPIQVLLNNLLYDASQVGIPSDQVDEEYLTAPRKWNIGNIQRFMIRIGPISSLFDYATFFLMLYFFKCILYSDAATPPAMKTYYESLFHTGWFVESILTQTLIVHIIRTPRIPFLQSIASPFLQFTTALVMIVGAVLPYSPFADYFGFVPLPRIYWVWIAGFLLCYACLTHIVKVQFHRRYGID